MACNLRCAFCFSKSSVSALSRDRWAVPMDAVRRYCAWAFERGARRCVITGGGEPLLAPELAVSLVSLGRSVFDEVALFTNGTRLDRELALRLADAGLSYVCLSRHHHDDVKNRALMGEGAPALDDVLQAAAPLRVRATCVMARGFVEHDEDVWAYVRVMRERGVRELTFKHTYVAYERSLFAGSAQDRWTRAHQVERDPFVGVGEVIDRLPWGPEIRRYEELLLCHYREPTPAWELENRLCRSSNLLSDGSVYASLEDRQSLLYRLPS
jgi:cyclic pyranopterin phosphate synthase